MRNSNQTTAQREIKALRAEVSRLSALAKEKTAETAGNVIGIEDIREFAENAGKSARRFIKDTRSQAVDLRDEAEGRITSHPFRAVGIAALAGAVFGMLFSPRR